MFIEVKAGSGLEIAAVIEFAGLAPRDARETAANIKGEMMVLLRLQSHCADRTKHGKKNAESF